MVQIVEGFCVMCLGVYFVFLSKFMCPALCHATTVALQAPLSMGFPKQEYWRGSGIYLLPVKYNFDLPTKKRYNCQDLLHSLSEPSTFGTADIR